MAISHPDEMHRIAKSSGWHRVQLKLCHPKDLGKLRMSPGWHSTLTISHPGEILPKAKSSGRFREQVSFICHPDDLLHRQCVNWLMLIVLELARTLDLPHYGPFVREYARNAALWDWYCFVVRLNKLLMNQSRRRWVQRLRHSCDVTVIL